MTDNREPEKYFGEELVRKAVLNRLEEKFGAAFWKGAARFLIGTGIRTLRMRIPRLNRLSASELVEVTLPNGSTLRDIVWQSIEEAARYWKVPRETPATREPDEALRLAFMAFARFILRQRLARQGDYAEVVPFDDELFIDQHQGQAPTLLPEHNPRVDRLARKLAELDVSIEHQPQSELLQAVMRVLQHKRDQLLLAMLQGSVLRNYIWGRRPFRCERPGVGSTSRTQHYQCGDTF